MKNYIDWKINEWLTPISKEKGLILDSLIFDSKGLVLSVSVAPYGKLFKFEFKGDCSFRMIDEGYRNELWDRIYNSDKLDHGATWLVDNTDFLEFLSYDCIFRTVADSYREYLFRIGDDIVEVISRVPPEISGPYL